MKENMSVAKTFGETMRYIDDLLTLNNTRFKAAVGDIYPLVLCLKKTVKLQAVSYLDLSISMCGNKYETEVYDKRVNFNFKIVNFSIYVK